MILFSLGLKEFGSPKIVCEQLLFQKKEKAEKSCCAYAVVRHLRRGLRVRRYPLALDSELRIRRRPPRVICHHPAARVEAPAAPRKQRSCAP